MHNKNCLDLWVLGDFSVRKKNHQQNVLCVYLCGNSISIITQSVCVVLLLRFFFAFLCSVICHTIIIKKMFSARVLPRGWHAAYCLGAFIHYLMFIVIWPLMKSGQPICGTQRYCQLKMCIFIKNRLHACNCYLRCSSLRTSSQSWYTCIRTATCFPLCLPFCLFVIFFRFDSEIMTRNDDNYKFCVYKCDQMLLLFSSFFDHLTKTSSKNKSQQHTSHEFFHRLLNPVWHSFNLCRTKVNNANLFSWCALLIVIILFMLYNNYRANSMDSTFVLRWRTMSTECRLLHQLHRNSGMLLRSRTCQTM